MPDGTEWAFYLIFVAVFGLGIFVGLQAHDKDADFKLTEYHACVFGCRNLLINVFDNGRLSYYNLSMTRLNNRCSNICVQQYPIDLRKLNGR